MKTIKNYFRKRGGVKMKCSDEKIYELAWRNYSKLYKEQYGVEPASKKLLKNINLDFFFLFLLKLIIHLPP